MRFKLVKDQDGNDRQDVILMIDGAMISWVPNDMANRHWAMYQAWLALGNEPEAAD